MRVNIFVDEAGNANIPGGQIVTPIGIGREPLDALAEFHRSAQLSSPSAPANTKNASFFFWCAKDPKSGKVMARLRPTQFTIDTEKAARNEARRRNLLGTFYAATPEKGFATFTRAEYWADVFARSNGDLTDSARPARLAM